MQKSKYKVIVVLGPTASGKTGIAIEIAKKINGEIISADSRQVYKGLDIGSGKVTEKEKDGIPHHLIDVVDAKNRFTVINWKENCEKAISEIIKRKNVPIICGGTGFYIQSIIENIELPNVESNIEEIKFLEEMPVEILFDELRKLDPRRAKEIDPKNKRRLARAIIIARELGKVPKIKKSPNKKYDFLQIGLTLPDDVLKKKIYKRLIDRFTAGMITEIENLHKRGLSYERMDELGLEYKYISQYLRGIILNKNELVEILNSKIWQFARRQKTWWRKDKSIKWFSPEDQEEICKVVKDFLK